ncbi:MAG TPA: alpha/beta fold hydrolase [Thermoanaerobaculia bacterium]|nr:alpha/beta fold hydrolase [Thermoanaerobaculia bacterium]
MELSAHLWTIGPRLRHSLHPTKVPPGSPWQLTVADPQLGSVVLSGALRERPESEEALVIVHGLGGSMDSHYVMRAAAAAEAAGLSFLRLNLRGSDLKGEDFYHAGLTVDLHAALASPELARYRRLYLLGYSVGGHLVLRYATDAVEPSSGRPPDARVVAVAALCPPLDLAASSAAFDAPGLWLYRRYVLGNVKRIYAAVAAHRPVPLPVEEARRIHLLREWDDRVVAPRHGFAGAADYYGRESVSSWLSALRLPALIIAAQADPMVPAATLLPTLSRDFSGLTVRWLAAGGHVAFPAHADTGLGEGPGVEEQVVGWLRQAKKVGAVSEPTPVEIGDCGSV